MKRITERIKVAELKELRGKAAKFDRLNRRFQIGDDVDKFITYFKILKDEDRLVRARALDKLKKEHAKELEDLKSSDLTVLSEDEQFTLAGVPIPHDAMLAFFSAVEVEEVLMLLENISTSGDVGFSNVRRAVRFHDRLSFFTKAFTSQKKRVEDEEEEDNKDEIPDATEEVGEERLMP